MNDVELQICHDLALLEVLRKLEEYKGISLSKGQIYAIYQDSFDPSSFEEIVKSGLREELK